MSASHPFVETEVKIRYPQGPEVARQLLQSHGYQAAGPRVLESDQLFDRPEGELRAGDRLLRVRRTGGGEATLTYKGPAERSRHKTREEIEFTTARGDALAMVLDRLGYLPTFRYEKYRTKFQRNDEQGIVTIDETPIGIFLELEGSSDWIDRTASELGFPPTDFVTKSYALLYREYCSLHAIPPKDMIF